jgi:hypothetical protein
VLVTVERLLLRQKIDERSEEIPQSGTKGKRQKCEEALSV